MEHLWWQTVFVSEIANFLNPQTVGGYRRNRHSVDIKKGTSSRVLDSIFNLKKMFKMAQKTKRCSSCKKDTVHQEFKDQAISGTNLFMGLLTGGASLLATSVRKGSA